MKYLRVDYGVTYHSHSTGSDVVLMQSA